MPTGLLVYRPTIENSSSQATRTLAQRLAAYIPPTLARRILDEGLPPVGSARPFTAATLFADISGFTAMSEELAADGPRGAEELNRALLMTFTAMSNAIDSAGGVIAHFHGDAMSVYFEDDDGRSAERALACARFMQSLMLTRAKITTQRAGGESTHFNFTIKIGVAYGDCVEFVVGHPDKQLEFVLAGTAVDEAAAVQQYASTGEVYATRAVLLQAGLPANEPYRALTEVPPVPSVPLPIYWEAYEPDMLRRLSQNTAHFLPITLYHRLQESNYPFVADHRPVTSLFVHFEGINYHAAEAGAQLQAYFEWAREIVARFGGENSRLNRVLTGDKGSQLHIFFGAPVAPDAPEQAIRCAIALQKERPSFITSQRIGLVAGQVFACAVGSQTRREYTIVGRVVNLSARLAKLCPKGDIFTNAATAVRVRETIQLEASTPLSLRGFSELVTPYRIQGEQTAQLQTRFARQPNTVVGRDKESSLLQAGLDKAREGTGRLIVVSGPAGSGRRQLLAQSVSNWLANGGTGLLGVCQTNTSGAPFGPWLMVWQSFFGLNRDMDIETQVTAVLQMSQMLCPQYDAEHALWGDLLGLPFPENEQLNRLPAEMRQNHLVKLMRDTLAAAAQAHSLLIVLEEIHWADQPSLDFIEYVAKELSAWPMAMVLTYQPSPHFNLEALHRANTIHITLHDLTIAEARELVRLQLGSDQLPDALAQKLGLLTTEGHETSINAFFLTESLRMMTDLGVLHRDSNGRLHIDENLLAKTQLPDTIYAALLSRLDALPPASRHILQAAAVMGTQFDTRTLQAILPPHERGLARQTLADLEAGEFLQTFAQTPEHVYIFQRQVIHTAVYQSIPFARRQNLHALIANTLLARHYENLKPVASLIAYHFAHSDQHEQAVRYALSAADEAALLFAHKEAAELYKFACEHLHALGEEKHWHTLVRTLQQRQRALRLSGELSQAASLIEEALRLTHQYGKPDGLWPLYNALALIRYYQAHYDEARQWAGKVLAAPDGLPSDWLAQAHLLCGLADSETAVHITALEHLQTAQSLWQNNPGQAASTLAAIATVQAQQTQLTRAHETIQEALVLGRSTASATRIGLIMNESSRILLRLGRPDEALTLSEGAVHLLRGMSRHLLARVLTQRGAVFLYDGQLANGRRDLLEARQLLEGMDDVPSLVEVYVLMGGEYYAPRGEWDEAYQALTYAGQLIQSYSQSGGLLIQPQIRLWLAMGRVAVATRRFPQAEHAFQYALRGIMGKHLYWWQAEALYGLGCLRQAEFPDDPRLARDYFKQSAEAVYKGSCPDILPLILLELIKSTPDDGRRLRQVVACVEAAQKQARTLDRIAAFRALAPTLMAQTDPALHALGQQCQQVVDAFDKERADSGKGKGDSGK